MNNNDINNKTNKTFQGNIDIDYLIKELKEIVGDKSVLPHELMKNHTTMKIGGRVHAYVMPQTIGDFTKVISYLRNHDEKFMIIGNASNLLFDDSDLDFVVVSTEGVKDIDSEEFTENKSEGSLNNSDIINKVSLYEDIPDELIKACDMGKIAKAGESDKEKYFYIKANAGAYLSQIARVAKDNSLTGFEGLSGIPGSVGGAVVMNAGAYGTEIKDVIIAAKVLDVNGNILLLDACNLKLSYRNSIIAKEGYIVLSAYFALKKGDKDKILETMKELNRKRRLKQPLEYPSCGSTFKRPEGAFAAKLIEDSGLKGYRIGDMMISEKHAGFMINVGNGTFKDALKLMEDVKEKVKKDSGFILEPEIKIVKKG